MRFEYPVPVAETQFGKVIEPTIELPLKLIDGYLSVRFFVDTGADVSMLPRSLAKYCGVDLSDTTMVNVTGIGGRGVRAWISKVTVRIGSDEITIPCLFSANENIPSLLGRAGVFDRYNIFFDGANRKVVFETI